MSHIPALLFVCSFRLTLICLYCHSFFLPLAPFPLSPCPTYSSDFCILCELLPFSPPLAALDIDTPPSLDDARLLFLAKRLSRIVLGPLVFTSYYRCVSTSSVALSVLFSTYFAYCRFLGTSGGLPPNFCRSLIQQNLIADPESSSASNSFSVTKQLDNNHALSLFLVSSIVYL